MKKIVWLILLYPALSSCGINKNIAQTSSMSSTDSLINNINASTGDTEIINPQLKKLQQQNDLVIAFGTLNFAWARKATYYVLASQNNVWKLYTYNTKLPPTPEDEAAEITPQQVSPETADNIKKLYASSELWKTAGDEDGKFCSGKKQCNINDAETWTISVATSKNIHTTMYYAPEFFEECCPGNEFRKRFIIIAKEMMKLSGNQSSLPEK